IKVGHGRAQDMEAVPPNPPAEADPAIVQLIAEARAQFVETMNDDFNTPAAMAGLFEFNKIVNTLLNNEAPAAQGTLEALDTFYREASGQVLGILPERAATAANGDREAALIRLLIDLRAEARRHKDFATSDAIRDHLKALGVILEDG